LGDRPGAAPQVAGRNPVPGVPIKVQERLAMMNQNFDLTCMMCGTNVGQLLGGRCVWQASDVSTSRADGRRRCGRCGGSLYVELMDSDADAAALEASVRAARIEADAAPRRRGRPATVPPIANGAVAAPGRAAPNAA
jgi:hypothetical protein